MVMLSASRAEDLMITPEGMKDFVERKPPTKTTDIQLDWRNTYSQSAQSLTLGSTSVFQLPQGEYVWGDVALEFQLVTTSTNPTGASGVVPAYGIINSYKVRFVGSADAEFTFSGEDLFYNVMDYCETQEKMNNFVIQAGGNGLTAGNTGQFVYAHLLIPPFSLPIQADQEAVFDSTITNAPIQISVTLSTLAQMTGATGLSINAWTLYARSGLYIDPQEADKVRKAMTGRKAKSLIPMKWLQSQSVNGTYLFTGPSMSISLQGFRYARCVGILIAATDVSPSQQFKGNTLTSIKLVYQGITLIDWPNGLSDLVRLELRDCPNAVTVNSFLNRWYFLPLSQIPANAWQKLQEMQNGKNLNGQTPVLTATSSSSAQQQLFTTYYYDAFMRIEDSLTFLDF